MKRFLTGLIAISILFTFSGITIKAQKAMDEAALIAIEPVCNKAKSSISR